MSNCNRSDRIVPPRGIPLDEMLGCLEKDHARILVALLMYGALTALEEGRLTADAAYGVVLNWRVFLYFEQKLKPRDRVLAGALSHSIELGTIGRHLGPRAIPSACKRVKARFASWWPKHLQVPRSSGRVSSRKLILESEIPLDQLLVDLDTERSRALLTLLLYGALAALAERLITLDVAKRAVMNRRVLLYCQEKLKPRDEALEVCLSRYSELDAIGRTLAQEAVSRVLQEMKPRLIQVMGTVTYLTATDGHADA